MHRITRSLIALALGSSACVFAAEAEAPAQGRQAVGSAAAPSGDMAKLCRITYDDSGTGQFWVRPTKEGTRCMAGSAVTFAMHQVNTWLSEQLCDFQKPIRNVPQSDSVPRAYVACTLTGEVNDPANTFRGRAVRYKVE